jgi:hypothetical protein
MYGAAKATVISWCRPTTAGQWAWDTLGGERIGVLGGPFGILLGGAMGVLIGSLSEANDRYG